MMALVYLHVILPFPLFQTDLIHVHKLKLSPILQYIFTLRYYTILIHGILLFYCTLLTLRYSVTLRVC